LGFCGDGVHTIMLIVTGVLFFFPSQGLYPESHGIIDNNMYDREIDEKFSLGSATSFDQRWWGGEPVSCSSYTLLTVNRTICDLFVNNTLQVHKQ